MIDCVFKGSWSSLASALQNCPLSYSTVLYYMEILYYTVLYYTVQKYRPVSQACGPSYNKMMKSDLEFAPSPPFGNPLSHW